MLQSMPSGIYHLKKKIRKTKHQKERRGTFGDMLSTAPKLRTLIRTWRSKFSRKLITTHFLERNQVFLEINNTH
jgi:hypothetical protein